MSVTSSSPAAPVALPEPARLRPATDVSRRRQVRADLRADLERFLVVLALALVLAVLVALL